MLKGSCLLQLLKGRVCLSTDCMLNIESIHCYHYSTNVYRLYCIQCGPRLLLILMNPRTPATMTKSVLLTLEICTVLNGWKTLIKYVYDDDDCLFSSYMTGRQCTIFTEDKALSRLPDVCTMSSIHIKCHVVCIILLSLIITHAGCIAAVVG